MDGPAVVVVGDLVTDVLVAYDRLVTGSDRAGTVRLAGGGQAANTAAWLARQGCAATLVTAVGDDAAGRERVAELTAAGVRCAVRVHPDAATGAVVVLVTGGERTMVTDRGAAALLDPASVTAAVAATPAAAHLHLSGYALLDESSRPAGLAALAAARGRGLSTSVDAASAEPLRRAGADAFTGWVHGCDVLLCNADEAAVLAGPGGAERQAARLTGTAGAVVVKCGAAGAVWADAAGLVSVPAARVPARDQTGAGDAFAAGLLAAWLGGAGPGAALAAGARLGAVAVTRLGGRPG